jgi:hypothetical protein
VLVERAFDAAAVTAAHNSASAVMSRTFERGMKSALMATPQPKIAVNSCVPPTWDSSNPSDRLSKLGRFSPIKLEEFCDWAGAKKLNWQGWLYDWRSENSV